MNTSPNKRTTEGSGRKGRRYLAAVALLSGGMVAGALFSPIGLAGAQSDADAEAPAAESSENGEREGRGKRGKGGLGQHLTEVTGLTAEQLREGFEAGNTLAETIEANGGDVDAVADAIAAQITERMNEAVADGKLTQEEADEKLADLDTKVDERLNAEPGERDGRGKRGPGKRGGGETADTADTGSA
ncbi:MAG: hypothetical protein AAGD35_05720 [Actinomycetota bacterium]